MASETLIDDHIWIPANRVITSATALPATASTGYTLLVSNTGEMYVWSCGAWVLYPASMGKLSTDGTDIYMNSGTQWVPIAASLQSMIDATNMCTTAGFTTSVEQIIANQIAFVDCNGDPLAGDEALPTCDQMMSAIAGATGGPVQSVQSGGGLQVNNGQLSIDAIALCTALAAAGCSLGGGGGGGSGGGVVQTVDTANGLGFNSSTGALSLNISTLCNALANAGCDLGSGGTGGTGDITAGAGLVVTPVGNGVSIGINCTQLKQECGISDVSGVHQFTIACNMPSSTNDYSAAVFGPVNVGPVAIAGGSYSFDGAGLMSPTFNQANAGNYPVIHDTNGLMGYLYWPGPNTCAGIAP